MQPTDDHATSPLPRAAYALVIVNDDDTEEALPAFDDPSAFLAANVDTFDDEDGARVRALAPGASIDFGGGAAVRFRLSRAASARAWQANGAPPSNRCPVPARASPLPKDPSRIRPQHARACAAAVDDGTVSW